LLVAVVVVAGVIGISGIYPQVIDADWVSDSSSPLPKNVFIHPAYEALRHCRRNSVTPASGHHAGEATVSAARPTPELSQPRTKAATAEAPAETAIPWGAAELPDEQAKANPLLSEPQPLHPSRSKSRGPPPR
jgi:hypothetical protein